MGLIGCDPNFVKELVSNPAYVAGTSLRYGMLADELLTLLDPAVLSPHELSMLTALVGSMRIKGLQLGQLRCITLGSLHGIRSEYLSLGVCCSASFFHNSDLDQIDSDVFNSNNVYAEKIGNIDFSVLINNSSHKVVKVFGLADGGIAQPIDCFGLSFRRAQGIVIYDRYFQQQSLQALEDLLRDAHSAMGPLAGTLLLLTGAGPIKMSEAQVHSAISAYFSNPSNVRIERSGVAQRGENYVHDRYIQIDDSKTFILTAGLSAFYDSAGANRASQIFEVDLFVGYETAEVRLNSDNSVVRIKY